MTYRPGQRVALVHTTDPDTAVRPGERGTVGSYQADSRTVDIAWDNGLRLSIRLDAGDRIRSLDEPTTPPASPVSGEERGGATLAAVVAAGATAGRAAAEWWARNTIGARVGGDASVTARRVLTGIDEGDPAILHTLPQPPCSVWNGDRHGYTDVAGPDVPAWSALTTDQRDAYHDAYTTALLDRVAALCRIAATPSHDLGHLHPQRLRAGAVGVFAGDWAWTTTPEGTRRIPVGFIGTLIHQASQGAVFTCTRPVAEAIVADQHHHRDTLRSRLQATGVTGPQLDGQVDDAFPAMTFDGDTMIINQRAASGDPDLLTRIDPDEDGEYLLGGGFGWEAVDPGSCDRIIGQIPAPGCAQRFVMLTHTPDMRVPHDRLRVANLHREPASGGYTAQLTWDGRPVATLAGSPGRLRMSVFPNTLLDRATWHGYVAACRFRGGPVSGRRVLEALIEEQDLTQLTAAAWASGGTVVRMLDHDHTTIEAHEVTPRPATTTDQHTLEERLAAHPAPDDAAGWVIWTGIRWRWHTRLHTSGSPA